MKKNYQCGTCGIFFNGIRKENRNKENFCSANCAITRNSKVKNRPGNIQILMMLSQGASYESVGREYGVSGNAVKKWLKKDGMHRPRKMPNVEISCDFCGKVKIKEYNQTVDNHGKKRKNLFCTRECKIKFDQKLTQKKL